MRRDNRDHMGKASLSDGKVDIGRDVQSATGSSRPSIRPEERRISMERKFIEILREKHGLNDGEYTLWIEGTLVELRNVMKRKTMARVNFPGIKGCCEKDERQMT
jgi:hypothetical protein